MAWASFIHRYTELGGGDFPSLTWNESEAPLMPGSARSTRSTASCWAFPLGSCGHPLRRITRPALHGYDFDFCLQVREAGRKVVTADFKVIHNHSLELANDLEHWSEAHVAVAEKWHGRMPEVGEAGGGWRHRARRAEAEAAVTRAVARSTQLKIDARALSHQREMRTITESLSWRLTAPLRRLKAFQRTRAVSRPIEHSLGEELPIPESVLGRRLG